MTLSDTINRIGVSIQPLVFETGVSEAPYSMKGTVFLVGYRGRAFALTARHALSESLYPLCIFPSDTTTKTIPLTNAFFVSASKVPDDYVDLVVMEVNLRDIIDPEVGCARIIQFELARREWVSTAETAPMFTVGFPEEFSAVDYDQEVLLTQRVILHGHYGGPSDVPYLHVIEVSGDGFSTFSGFSGAPVFASIEESEGRGTIALCGMVLRGTPGSQKLHFLDSSVLHDALDVVTAR